MPPSSQVEYWNDPAVAADLQSVSHGVSTFAKRIEHQIPRESSIVELGCGVGDDASYLASKGHSVIAIDVSEPLLEVAAQRFANYDNLSFRQADISQPLDVGGDTCDVVYSRFSLHYFDDETTERILGEVFWILRNGGQFFFAARSTDDPLYGRGTEIAPDMFELDGHVRHFFSRDFALDLMEDIGFIDVEVELGQSKIYGNQLAFVLCSGRHP